MFITKKKHEKLMKEREEASVKKVVGCAAVLFELYYIATTALRASVGKDTAAAKSMQNLDSTYCGTIIALCDAVGGKEAIDMFEKQRSELAAIVDEHKNKDTAKEQAE